MPTFEENTPQSPPPLFVPYVITVPPPDPDEFLLPNPLITSVMVIHVAADENPHQPNKDSLLPASKKSIEGMPTVKVTESEKESSCPICLGEYEIGGEAKEMPCKHRYHPGCIDKWLGIHGSCPVCRYEMPVEEEGGWDAKVIREEENREGFRLSLSIIDIPWSFDMSSGYGGSDEEEGGSSDWDEAAHDMEID